MYRRPSSLERSVISLFLSGRKHLTKAVRRVGSLRYFLGLQFVRRDQPPCFAYVEGELFIGDAIEFDADPARATNVWRFVEFLRRPFDEHRLYAGRGWNHHRYVAVLVMIEGAHREDLLAEESRLSVREFFG